MTNVTGWDVAPAPVPSDTAPRVTGSSGDGLAPIAPPARRAARQDTATPPTTAESEAPPQQPKKEEKKGFFRRLIGVFK